ncbi:MAG: class I SAM-dependent methyltransferase [Candidatus Lernaella stagnicola]|nr:class I SAM-dependent methyltransferase [Candidatus Lernaella stagnicola]
MAKRIAGTTALLLAIVLLVAAGLWIHNRFRYKMFHSLAPTAEATDRQRNMENNRQVLNRWAAEGRDPMNLFKSMSLLPTMADLGLKDGDVIADIGAGTGAFEIRLLRGQVDVAKIYAVDTDALSLEFLRATLDAFTLPGEDRVHLVHSRPEDVMLPENQIDVVTVINCRLGIRDLEKPLPQKDLEERNRLYQSIYRALKKEGHVTMVEPVREASFKTYPVEYLTAPFFANGFCLESHRIDTKLYPQYYYFPIRYHVMRFRRHDAPNLAEDAVCGS